MHFTPTGNEIHGNRRDLQNLRHLLPYLSAYKGRALLALLCLVISKVSTVSVPLVLKDIIDKFDGKETQVLVLPVALLIAYGVFRLLTSLFNELRDTVFARVRYHAMRELSKRVMQHLHKLSLRFHLQRKTGAISRDLERGTRSVSTLMNFLVFSTIPIFVEFSLVAFILLSNYAVIFALVTFGTVLFYVAFTLMVTEWRMHYRHDMNRLDSQANTHAFDSLINYETVKYFNNERLEQNRYDEILEKWENVAVKSQSTMSMLNFGQGAIIAVGVTIIMFLAANGVVEGTMSIGDLVMVNAFMLQLFIPLNALGIIYRQIKYTLADMDLVFKLLKQKPEIQDVENATDINVSKGEVKFEDVSFAYDKKREILHGVNFTIPAGKTVAVVGFSGGGKSTLVRLLFRFYDVSQGRILIDGQDIKECTQDSLRETIGIVPQDTVLFNESIFYNIQYGNLDASREEVENAAKMAHIYDFIEGLPDGWDSVVGERGLKLSGGEKQRVAIARTILKKPPILIFDEATSSLDSATEQAIQKTLGKISSKTSTLIIAHRLSTIVDADMILVMEAGKIIERGSHLVLLEQQGRYSEMWNLQRDTQGEDSDNNG
ncbi:ABCB family ABC transporter ATP-binding protein/permease [Cocleimonas flava]|uniref:ATP-binding cassette subfamily B protein n=1 Tax=Cocleimonas flava TaxID=634765 RepID=A0A4R1EPK0_9GAMM|nr:ABC transporter ATP-binding protein/permease [Cocleimonas flava]TCJ82923.1 ATP-binding cassette subfamily B protein [Cocleimonas flava]